MRGCDVWRNVIAGRRRYTEAERQRGPQRGDLAAVFKTENRLLCIDTMRMFAMMIFVVLGVVVRYTVENFKKVELNARYRKSPKR
jgi:hypothetical protein